MPFDILVLSSLCYVAFLFLVAWVVERKAIKGGLTGRLALLQSPLVYTLSLSIFCSAWTFTAPWAMPPARGWSS